MRRRDVLALVGATTLRPLAVLAQQKATPVIGWLTGTSFGPNPTAGPIHQGLSDVGYIEGQNLAAEYRAADGDYDRLPALAADLVSRKVDLIIAIGGPGPVLAAKRATSTIPILFVGVGDPLALGLVGSLARPDGNITGFSVVNTELMPKRLELLFELVPHARVIALLVNPNNPLSKTRIADMQDAARVKNVELQVLRASNENEIDAAFETLHADALILGADPFLSSRRVQIAALALRHAVPTVDQERWFVEAGGLISYGARAESIARQAGVYAGRILNGEKPADLPVQQPTVFELVINLKTAKALGLTVPQSLLARADEVIE